MTRDQTAAEMRRAAGNDIDDGKAGGLGLQLDA